MSTNSAEGKEQKQARNATRTNTAGEKGQKQALQRNATRARFVPKSCMVGVPALRACGWAGADEVGVRSPASGRRGLLLVR